MWTTMKIHWKEFAQVENNNKKIVPKKLGIIKVVVKRLTMGWNDQT